METTIGYRFLRAISVLSADCLTRSLVELVLDIES
jgi:hypothetical protein